MAKKYWGFPSFNPDRLDTLSVRRVAVIYWTDRDDYDICINVTQSLRNENHLRGYFMSLRMKISFEKTPGRRFNLKRMNVVESTVVLTVSRFDPQLVRFRAIEPLLLASRNPEKPESRLVLSGYSFDELVTGSKKTDDDIPF